MHGSRRQLPPPPLRDGVVQRRPRERPATLPEDTTAAAGDDYVTLDVGEESPAAHSVREAAAAFDSEEKKSSFRSSTERNAPPGIQQESDELTRLDTPTRRLRSFYQTKWVAPRGQRSRSGLEESAAAQALKGLELIPKSVGGATWTAVEKRFDELTSTTTGVLPRSLFGECIGMNKESEEQFAVELFDALSRRRRSISGGDSITKEELKEFWDLITDPSFDGRLQIFFDMIDKDADGRITEDEVREIISMGASANKLSNIQKQADEYARLIMEELDPDNLGYIMIENLEMLLLQAPNQTVEDAEERRWNRMLGEKIKYPEQDHLMKKRYRDLSRKYASIFSTWMYVAVPILINAGERLIRAFRSSNIKPVKILKVVVYPGDVLVLHMSKPKGFRYKSGQYIFVKCKAVSSFEWHRFAITSAPRDDYLILHFLTLGGWTRKLKVVFSEEQPPTGKNGLLRADFMEGENNPNFSTLLIDGPYGAPTEDYKNYDVVLLIGIGIGATPLISITKDIINNIKAIEDEEDARFDFKTRRAYLHWVNREEGSFDWFNSVLNEVAGMDSKGVIEMHNYYTSVYEEGDARSALIAMLQSVQHTKNVVDTRVKTHFARPNWRTVYKGIAITYPNSRIGVFYYGAPLLVPELRQLSSDFTHKTSTMFRFHINTFDL